MLEDILVKDLKKDSPPWQRVIVVILLIGISSTVTYFITRQKRTDNQEDETAKQQQETIDKNRKFSLRKDSVNEAYVKIIIDLNQDKQDLAKELYELYKQKDEDAEKTIKRQDSVLKVLRKL